MKNNRVVFVIFWMTTKIAEKNQAIGSLQLSIIRNKKVVYEDTDHFFVKD